MKTLGKIFLTIILIFSICLLVLSSTLNQITTQVVAGNLSEKYVSDKIITTLEQSLPSSYSSTMPVIKQTLEDSEEFNRVSEKYIDAITSAVTEGSAFKAPDVDSEFDSIFKFLAKKIYSENNNSNTASKAIIDQMVNSMEKNKADIIAIINQTAVSVVNDNSSTQKIIKTYSAVNSTEFKVVAVIVFFISMLLCIAITKSLFKGLSLVGLAFLISGFVLVFLIKNLMIELISSIVTSYAGYNIVIDATAVENLGIISIIIGAAAMIITQLILFFKNHKHKNIVATK